LSDIYTPTCNLHELWVSSDAETEYGQYNHGLPLPLPSTFARLHPGVDEALVDINRFQNATLPRILLTNPLITEQNDPQVAKLDAGGIKGGIVVKDDVPPNNVANMNSYTLIWAEHDYLIRVNVQGYSVTVQEADAVAKMVAVPGRT
jgi:hypothetical protein